MLCYAQHSVSQNIPVQFGYKSITFEDGLPNNKVNAITMDQYGFVWFGTNDGVCRYDGMDIVTYNLDPLNTTGTNINHINTLFTDVRGNLWIGAFSLFRYNYDTDSMVHYDDADTALVLGRIRAMANGSDGLLWIGSTNGLFSYNTDMDSLFKHPYLFNKRMEILSLLPDNDKIWIGTKQNGLLIYYTSL